ncbi:MULTISPECIES: bifunctional glycosyltransferase family 2 protein/CDP-glycerol:glycerophosphate glycerophosphotransferase [unclassified Streptomyces]|uniref:bifunctional glycosyltransferase/CDP-glycerol:glycerophosphate glycerophosphotransferase n=1 Tax=unclassified Streptomyces TaxID=2593676 RepID=UPI000DD63810|nr:MULTISPECIES: bifunctional glycosyltransferase family 2 protein/CDP-glycerol:glycerophosphate glycerophosphotransferase [unclassified Streptomyces]QZZ28126.1 bifunctional glycosyltransferase family 2 protein/CDP-glycerol:glycerophosphate glycerophosphotransferase [Streptomyces sp. ST1015]
MPRFSVIVPSHGGAGRLALALDSVLAQRFWDFELIPVCDGPDCAAAAVVAGYAKRDARIVPVHSPPDAGLAGARNAGLLRARGAYVLFLDGDDQLAPDALTAVAARLKETGELDVLHVEHERLPWWEGEPTNPTAGLRAPKGVFAPAQAPHLTGVQVPAWSAVYRRGFLSEHQITFPGGYFVDVGFGGLVALHAERVAVLRRVVVRHLLRRQGGRLNLPGEHHLQLLDQAELLLWRAVQLKLPAERLGPLFEQLFAAVLKTAAHPGRLAGWRRRAFFRRAGRMYRRYRPAGFRRPGGSLGVQHLLLAAGAFTLFRALRRGHRKAGTFALPRRTPSPLKLPLDPNLAVYCAYWGRGYTCNPAAIHAKARQLAPHIRSVFLVEPGREHTVPEGVEHATLGGRRATELLATATYLVNNANFPAAVVKREGSVHLQTQHGTPLKTMGVDQARYPVVASVTGSYTTLMRKVDRWDFNLSANSHSTQVWERAFPGTYEQLEYGYPRNDVFYTATADEVAALRRTLGVPDDKTAVLYAPTYRDYRSGFETGLDLAEFCAAAGDDVVVLLRAHYYYDRGRRLDAGRVIDVTGHPSAEEVCLAADVLVTDYSSIMFDYANLDRPIVAYVPDWEVYAETRGVYLDLPGAPPGPVARTPEELGQIFAEKAYLSRESAELRAEFRSRFCEFDDGMAAERVVRRVLLGEPPEALPPVVPLAERTPAPAPGSPVPSDSAALSGSSSSSTRS